MGEASRNTNLLTLADAIGGMATSVRDESRADFEQMYKPSEPIFGAVARQMVTLGWSVFPQELDGNRRPGKAGGDIIRWSEEHALAERMPTPEALDLWIRDCSPLNVATVFGPASGNSFALDIDVLDPHLSARLVELADRILGRTPLRRIGLAPKIALIYRHAPGETVLSTSRRFAAAGEDSGGVPGEDGVEVLSRGKLLTFWGKHHKTGRYFLWPDRNPFNHGPESAPEVTAEQVDKWLRACDSVRRFHCGASYDVASVEWTWDESAGLHVPRLHGRGGGIEWVEDEEGRVVDGREAFLRNLVYRACRANKRACGSEAGVAQIAAMVRSQFLAHAEASGRWSGSRLDREVIAKVRRTTKRVLSGEIETEEPVVDEHGQYVAATSSYAWIPPRHSDLGAADSLVFLPPAADPSIYADKPSDAPRKQIRCVVRPASDAARQERAIALDRREATAAVQDKLRAAFDQFFDEVYARDPASSTASVDILKAPTGAGKTSQAIRYIAADPRTKEDYPYLTDDGTVQQGRCPILFLLPTYNNIDELRARSAVLNLDPDLPDDAFRAKAVKLKLIHADDLDEKVADLRRDAMNAGLTSMVYKGKIAAGCKMAEKVQLAMQAGVGTAAFCRSQSRGRDGEIGEKYCEFFHDCDAIKQRKWIGQSHVVFLPHPFMSLTIPEELKHVRAVIADERIHHLFLHTTTMDLDTLDTGRKSPRLSKRDERVGNTKDDLKSDRASAASIVRDALIANECPAQALLVAKNAVKGPGEYGAALVESALKICSSAIQRDAALSPEMTLEEVRELCALPTGKQAREEYRFWTIIQERLQALIQDSLAEPRIAALQAVLEDPAASPDEAEGARRELSALRRAKGARDYRIQLQSNENELGQQCYSVRLSWRQEPNWLRIPLLLLDASAAPEVIRKIWRGANVKVHDISAPLNVRVVGVVDRTYSNASIIPKADVAGPAEADAACMLDRVRNVISLISSMYGWGRVVAGSSIAVRRAVNHAWACPENVDWCHYGALRGLDFAKFHAAAVSIGRMEVPVRAIDGLVAALTYDDDDPEEPLDRLGTGKTEDGKDVRLPMGTQTLRMRSGHDIEIAVPTFPGKWGRLMQRQYREEEQVQFLGRLRPVYREGEAPIWFALSSVIPDDVIVDDIISMDDLLNAGPWDSQEFIKLRDRLMGMHLWEAARRTRGVLQPDIIFAACPDLYASTEAVDAEMQRAGMDELTGRCDGRLSWGFTAVRILWEESSDASYAFVRSDWHDLREPLAEAAEKHLGCRPYLMEPMPRTRELTPARGRAVPDNVDIALGTRDQRLESERDIAAYVARWVFEDLPAEAFNIRRKRIDLPARAAIPIGESVVRSLTYAQLEARESTRRLRPFLETVAAESKPAETRAVDQDGNFEHFGYGIDDVDASDGEDASIPW